jgi:hypothetical protein
LCDCDSGRKPAKGLLGLAGVSGLAAVLYWNFAGQSMANIDSVSEAAYLVEKLTFYYRTSAYGNLIIGSIVIFAAITTLITAKTAIPMFLYSSQFFPIQEWLCRSVS